MADIYGMVGALGASTINNIGSGIFGGIGRRENYRYNEMAAENADRRTRALYNDLYSPQAQLQQLKAAGLSPSLFYGDAGGMSGQSGAQGAGTSGLPQSNFYALDPLTLSQIKVNEAQANEMNANADLQRGEGKRGEAEVAKIIADTISTEASTKYKNLQTEIAETTKAATINEAYANAEIASTTAQKLVYELITSQISAEIAEKTKDNKIRQEKLIADNFAKDLLAKQSTIELNKTQREKLINEMDKWQEELLQGWTDLIIKNKQADSYKDFVHNLNEYFDQQMELGWKRLDFDKNKLDREMRLEWFKLLETFIDHSLNRGVDFIGQVTSLAGKAKAPVKTTPIGFGRQ